MKEYRLSSDNLYHFKKDFWILKSIIKDGFQYRLWEEDLPYYKDAQQYNYMSCFCDIKINETTFHRNIYGQNALVLSKDWGMKNGITPVRYIHENSVGIDFDYIQTKSIFRELRKGNNDDMLGLFSEILIFSYLKDQDKITHDSIDTTIKNNPNLRIDITNIQNELNSKLFEGLSEEQSKIFQKYFFTLINRFNELHNQLEKRDSLIRAYNGPFIHSGNGVDIKNKVFYDEREWRAVKHPLKDEIDESFENKHLPIEKNLKFSDEDLIAILVENETNKQELIDYLESSDLLISKQKTLNKIFLINDYDNE